MSFGKEAAPRKSVGKNQKRPLAKPLSGDESGKTIKRKPVPTRGGKKKKNDQITGRKKGRRERGEFPLSCGKGEERF